MNIWGKIFSTGAKELVGTVGKVIDDLTTSKEEKEAAKLAFEQAMQNFQLSILDKLNDIEKAYLADIQSARETNAKIQGDRPSWLAKNLAYVIDAFVTILWGILTTYLMAVMLHLAPKQAGVDYTAVTAVWGAVSATFGTVINFHRGSSQGSQDKQKILDKLNR